MHIMHTPEGMAPQRSQPNAVAHKRSRQEVVAHQLHLTRRLTDCGGRHGRDAGTERRCDIRMVRGGR